MILLDGKATSASLQAQIAAEVDYFLDKGWRRPHLTAILVGDDGASQTYVANKERSCKKVGFDSTVLRLPASTTEEELLAEVKRLNRDDSVDGFIIQLPLPKHIDEQKIIEAVSPSKDVDGFHPENVGRLCLGLDTFVSATPYGIITLLEEYGIETRGKHCVVLGRSNIVGRPIANLLSAKARPGDCTVTICHSRTQNIEQYTRSADIIIAALGVSGFVKADMVKEGAVVIDVGITRVPAETEKGYRIMGDVDFDAVAPKCSYITPVPGGVGPMTIVSLMRNTLKAYTATHNQ
ncbi:MAG: bifunctional 5,10-methylene-tetrahydrofolate dehydrogenase/5,10-methylene-tetrahydrofolate cyclohydrolase [Bacteroidales bacterium]|nr:bifunctional 5,10-methylene-tetrahydrofolate dehydrogenase/5,10-methylene-tetrahydrofolate cyclohydrolase [Bacteroidales bacterium]